MANSTKDIKRRIKSISGTLQITKALELISSIKMRHAIKAAETSRSFSDEIWQLIATLGQSRISQEAKLPPLYNDNTSDTKKNLLIIIAGDKGLAGSYNGNVLRQAKEYFKENQSIEIDVITVGKKAQKIKQLSASVNIISDFINPGSEMDFFQASPITKLAIDSYLGGAYQKVTIIYTRFINTLRQKAISKNLLPIGQIAPTPQEEMAPVSFGMTQTNQATEDLLDFKYEPDQYTLLETLGRLAIRGQIYQALLEAEASEHAARMVAMKNATENGNELVGDLQFTYNQLRQQNITRELSEIAAGAAAIQ
jgi:F-type H+-transporting ATPase subunit gamma